MGQTSNATAFPSAYRVILKLAVARSRIEMDQPSGLLERQAAQEEIIDQAKDRGVKADPEREREHGEKGEARGLEQLPESKSKISRHKNRWMMRLMGEMRPRAQSDSKK